MFGEGKIDASGMPFRADALLTPMWKAINQTGASAPIQRCYLRRGQSVDALTAEQFQMEWTRVMRNLWLVGTQGMD